MFRLQLQLYHVFVSALLDTLLTLFHKPFGRTCGSTDAYGMHIVGKPRHIYLVGTFYLIAVGIDAMALLEQHLTITALSSRHKQYKVVTRSKRRYVWHTVGYLSADGIEALELGSFAHVFLYVFYYTMETIERLSGLRIQIDIAREVKTLNVIHLLYYNGMARSLPYQSQHLSMSTLTEDNYLRLGIGVILALYAAL